MRAISRRRVIAYLLAVLSVASMGEAFGPVVADAHTIASSDTDPVTGGLGDGEVNLVGKGQFDGNGTPVAQTWLPNDPYRYNREPVCVEDRNNAESECFIRTSAQCAAGENGMLMRIFRSLKSDEPPNWEDTGLTECRYDGKIGPHGSSIPPFTLSDFKRLPIAASRNVVQPWPHTLRGSNTNFYAEASDQIFHTSVLGVPVEVKAIIIGFSWSYGVGDG